MSVEKKIRRRSNGTGEPKYVGEKPMLSALKAPSPLESGTKIVVIYPGEKETRLTVSDSEEVDNNSAPTLLPNSPLEIALRSIRHTPTQINLYGYGKVTVVSITPVEHLPIAK